MQHRPLRDGKEMSHFVRNRQIHYRVQNNPPLDPIIWHLNVVTSQALFLGFFLASYWKNFTSQTLPEMLQVIHLAKTNLLPTLTRDHNWSPTWARWIQHTPTFTFYFFPFHFSNTILLFVGLPYGPFPSYFSTNFWMHFPLLMYVARPVNPLPFESPKIFIEMNKLLNFTMHSSSLLLLLSPSYVQCSQHPGFTHPQYVFFPHDSRPGFTPIQNNRNNLTLFNLILSLQEGEWTTVFITQWVRSTTVCTKGDKLLVECKELYACHILCIRKVKY